MTGFTAAQFRSLIDVMTLNETDVNDAQDIEVDEAAEAEPAAGQEKKGGEDWRGYRHEDERRMAKDHYATDQKKKVDAAVKNWGDWGKKTA